MLWCPIPTGVRPHKDRPASQIEVCAGVIGHTHKHTHHVTIALHVTTAARGLGGCRGGATKGISFLDHHAGQGKARHVDAGKYITVLLPQLLCFHSSSIIGLC